MKELDLGKEKIGKLLFTFSIPCIISMLINSVYNIVDQIFIGQGVGYLGNAATNVIFPFVIICNAIAQLIGNGCAAGLSLRLGEDKKDEAKKAVGSSIVSLIMIAIIFSIISYLSLPILIKFFGCTKNVYSYALAYGKIIVIGSPFMIIYTGLSSIIRADGSPKYSMICLVTGAIINIILDPIFIFTLNKGVVGGAFATIIGQIVSCIIALLYIPKIKSIDLSKKDFKINKSIFKTLGYGLSSFITQMTILVLFIFMNNIMTKYGLKSKFGGDIPLSVYGVISKINSLYVSAVLGISIGAQPIIGFNYGRGNYERVKLVLKRVLIINFIIGIVFNLIVLFFPKQIISLFGSSDNNLYLKFAIDFCRIFLMVCFFNVFEMSTSITIQSLGNIKKATSVSFIRQIILFIPLSLLLTHFIGLYGALYAGPLADTICFITVIFIFGSEYKKIGRYDNYNIESEDKNNYIKNNKKLIITINREYGSGGRYVAKLLAEKLNIKFYDKEIIKMTQEKSGFDYRYIEENEQKKTHKGNYEYNNDDKLFIEESKVIKEISKESCVIVGRCADYILEGKKIYRVFLYNNLDNKIKRAVKYYGLEKENAAKKINRINEARAKHYKYYTNRNWKDLNNYDVILNVDKLGVEKTAELLYEIINQL